MIQFEVGDKVICIEDYNNGGWLPKNYSLTKGQIYEVSTRVVHTTITIEGKGNVNYPIELFITLEQWREQQLNQLGI
jgi:hypothetical protein